MTKSIQELQDEIVDEFSLLENRDDVYEYIIEIGKKLPDLSEEHKTNENLIKGCQSKVWLVAHLDEENNLVFEGDSDALIVRGLVSLLIRVLSGQSPEAILHCELYFIEKIGMRQIISSSRSNGLTSMIKQMKLYALAFQTKIERAKI
ncbi:MAG TPA: SufE family protein [Cytophagales bacterium]|nr:SufE family protein [Cytophagales bacterium]